MGVEAAGPLLTLVHRVRCLGPPVLSTLINQLEGAEDYQDFVAIVREFLPEWESEILHESTMDTQIATFASRFESRYFPLNDWFMEGVVERYADLICCIPVMVMGISWEGYHDIADNYRPGFQLMTYLLEDPYEEESGARIALADACSQYVSRDLLQQVPQGGISREQAHQLYDGTSYEAVALWADILYNDTGTYFLDTTSEYEDAAVPWRMEDVESLTEQWLRAQETQQKVISLAEWLEEDPPAHFGELLDCLERR